MAVLAVALPPLPALSALFDGEGSNSAAVAVAELSNAPGALIVADTLMVVFATGARLAIVQGRAEQPEPETAVMVRFAGVSLTWMFVATGVKDIRARGISWIRERRR